MELPTWTNNRLMTCKYGGANQAAVPTGHGKRRRDPFRSLARSLSCNIGWKGRKRVSDIPRCICKPDLRTCVARAVATRAYIFNGCTLIALCLPIPHSTLHLHVHPHSLHPFRARNSPLLACAAPRRAAARSILINSPRAPTTAGSRSRSHGNLLLVAHHRTQPFPRAAFTLNVTITQIFRASPVR